MPCFFQCQFILPNYVLNGERRISQAAGLLLNLESPYPPGSKPVWVYPEIVKSRTLARSMLKRKFDIIGPKNSFQILSQVGDIDKFWKS